MTPERLAEIDLVLRQGAGFSPRADAQELRRAGLDLRAEVARLREERDAARKGWNYQHEQNAGLVRAYDARVDEADALRAAVIATRARAEQAEATAAALREAAEEFWACRPMQALNVTDELDARNQVAALGARLAKAWERLGAALALPASAPPLAGIGDAATREASAGTPADEREGR
jgi:hypothetical protein